MQSLKSMAVNKIDGILKVYNTSGKIISVAIESAHPDHTRMKPLKSLAVLTTIAMAK
ncbi:hypothetical protein [Candidatus Pseudomonas adelgestsugas]|uniref:hypothetical protein n=1 Tax=Candidatus Pseudomonas adelgestsugas TaxID=1302376 RepID=UPI001300B3BA|nr:hypothetical protein [Candidatus Pseudomonas adelgestsugas]